MIKSSSLLRTAVFGIFIAAAFGQFGFGGSPFQGQGGAGFRGQIGGVGGGGFRGPIGGGVGGGGFRGPINAVQGGGSRGPIGGPASGGQLGGFNPFAGLFQQAQQAPDPPLPKGRVIKTKNKGELVDYLVGVIVKNHERIAHITHHNYSEILDEELDRHQPTKLDAIKQAIQIHNLLP